MNLSIRKVTGRGSGGSTAALIIAVMVIAIVAGYLGADPTGIAVSTLAFLLGIYALKVFQIKRFGRFDLRF